MNNNLGENSLDQDIDLIIDASFVKLAGFIINYDEDDNYSSLFSGYLGINLGDEDDYENFLDTAYSILDGKKRDFLDLQKRVEGHEGEDLGPKQTYILKNFESIELFFDVLELYIPVEGEKIKRFSDLDDKVTSEHIQKIVTLEEQIFGKEVYKQDKYANIALERIKSCQESPAEELTEDESIFLNNILSTVEEKTGSDNVENQINDNGSDKNSDLENSSLLNIVDDFGNNGELNNELLSKMIPREQYCKIFKLAFEILGMPEMEVQVKKGITNISVSYEGIQIPDNDDYAALSVERIISLIAHELERHSITNENNLSLIGNMKSLSYLGKEEGLAHNMEFLAKGYGLDDIPINRYLPRMLVGEVVPGDDFKEFLRIMNKLDGENLNVENSFNRFKRGKSYNLPGVNAKEKLYGIGALETIDRLRDPNNEEDPRDLFLAKNGYKEQESIVEVSEKSDKKLIFPLLLGELIRYEAITDSNKETGKGLEKTGFIKFFWNKYGELFGNLGLSLKDLISDHIKENITENREKVKQIIEIIKEA